MKKALAKYIPEFYPLFSDLEEKLFEPLLKDIYQYLNRFQTKEKKILFLEYIQQRIYDKPGGSIFIYPEEIDHESCYLSKFEGDHHKIAWLFTYRIERTKWELKYNPNYRERVFGFELKYEHRENLTLEQVFQVLYDCDYIDDYQKDDFLLIFSAEDIYQIDANPIKFSKNHSSIATLFEHLFRELFVTIDESKIFGSHLFENSSNKVITAKMIHNARSKILNKPREKRYLADINLVKEKLSIKKKR